MPPSPLPPSVRTVRFRLRVEAALALSLSLLFALCAPLRAAERPNVLWITAEDMSLTLGCYGDAYAKTPVLDALAKESVRYTAAFAAAPVCSPSRSTLITGMWAPSLGTSQMRSTFPLPPEVHGFPSYLRETGYFATNQVKTDYNTSDEPRLVAESWDDSSATADWRAAERAAGQPFFSVINLMTTHQSRTMVWTDAEFRSEIQSRLEPSQIHDPAAAPVPPYYPDTEPVRRGLARFYDCVAAMDAEVGAILSKLEEDGLADDTIVFFYSDHGSGMPRHKRLLHDSGLQVPLLVRFPEKFRHLAPVAPGETVDRLVTFADLPPTVLSLAGVPIPEFVQGQAFLGPEAGDEAEFVYGFRDRVDEVFDLARSVRSSDYLYIRNHMPHLSWGQRSVYSDLGEIQREMFRYAEENADALTGPQRAYLGPTRPPEEFYDVAADPMQLHNLLDGGLSPEQSAALEAHRAAYAGMREELLDLAFVPEPILVDFVIEEEQTPRDMALGRSDHRPDLHAAWAAADLVGKGSREELLALARDGDPAVRYWGLIGLRHAYHRDEALLEELYDSMDDISATVRIEAAAWMAEVSDRHRDEAVQVLGRELVADHWWVALRACRAVEMLGIKARALLPVMETLYARHRHAGGDGSLYLAFSAGAFLQAMGMPTEPWDFGPGS